MIIRALRYLLLPLLMLAAFEAHAEPYLAVQTGFKCGQCHVNPTGGGERTVFGNIFAQTQLAAHHIDTGSDIWTGELSKFFSVGGDLRAQAQVTKQPGTSSTDDFEVEQGRIYASANVIPGRLYVYVDEQVAPSSINREAYGVYWSKNHDWYVKAGQMYLPFGFRLQDQTALVQQITGINMTTPDQGVEFGVERGHWDAQLAISNGTAGGPEKDHGKQYSGQLSYVERFWRVGLAANINNAAAGNKTAAGLFGGLRTGPISWLGQVDITDDKSLPALSGRQLATLLEANWRIVQGHNLKLTHEYLDPNRSVSNDAQTRYSLVYELTPIQYVQIRSGFRYSDGIPQSPVQHLKVGFVELHGFF
jgi:hypothetical protein